MATDILSALGSGSGINTTQLVEDLVSVQKAPQQNRLDARTEQATAQLSAYGVLKSALADFQSQLTPLADPAIFNAKAINVPTTDLVTFNSLTSEAQAGNYQLEVEQTAASQSLAFNLTETDASQALGQTGTLTFNIGSWDDLATVFTQSSQPSFDVVISDDDSLSDIADKINAADANVLASVISIDGKLQLLVSAESGEDNALQITSDVGGELKNFEYNPPQTTPNPDVTLTQQGKDSIFKLNGLQITRSNNNITDVVPGLDFTLEKADIGTNVGFSISADKSSAQTAIESFVEAYNTLLGVIKPLIGVSTDENNNTVTGGLAKDGTAKNLVRNLGLAISNTVNGLDPLGGFTALAAVGVTTQLDGTLTIDDEQFSKVISENFAQLAGLFGEKKSSSSNYLEINTGSFAAHAVAGEYEVKITQQPAKGYFLADLIPSNTQPITDTIFKINVNGTTSNEITLSGSFNSDQELAAALQSAINSDENLKGINIGVDVTVEGGKLKISSREYGSSSNISFTSDSAEITSVLGIDPANSGVVGENAQGTINGEAAFGTSNILLPAVGSPAYGLNITVDENTTVPGVYTISFSRGLAGDLALFVSTALADGGQIDSKEDLIETEKVNIEVDQEKLDRKMSAYQERLSSQFAAMERIIASLSSTESQLDGLIDRLPFTASN